MIPALPAGAKAAARLAPERWGRLLQLWDDLGDVDADVTVEDFAPFAATVKALARLGVPFDAGFLARIAALEAGAMGGDDDPDTDDPQSDLEADDDNDPSFTGGFPRCEGFPSRSLPPVFNGRGERLVLR